MIEIVIILCKLKYFFSVCQSPKDTNAFVLHFKKIILKAAIKILNLKKLSFNNAVEVCERAVRFPFPIHTPTALTHCQIFVLLS